MHSITFAIPQFSAASSDAEKDGIRDCISRCVASLREIDPRSRDYWGDEKDGEVCFLLPRVFSRGSKLRANARAAEALLECLTEIDVLYWTLRGGVLEPLYVNPLYYKRTAIWDTTPALYARGYGDCKSLACTRTAEYRMAGRMSRSFFRFIPPELNPDREFMYHIVTGKDQPPMGRQPIPWEPTGTAWEDPSKVKGMGQNEWAYFDQKPKNVGDAISKVGSTLYQFGHDALVAVDDGIVVAGEFISGLVR
jgi:hypothetical protein